MAARRQPGHRAGLTRGQVLAAARAQLADGGLAALTMRALARRLEVTPNALYSHVESKTALVDELLDDLLAEVEAPVPGGGDWREDLRTVMRSTHRVLLANPDTVPLYLARRGARGANALRLGDLMLEALARGGITGPPAREALRVLIVHAIGSAAFTTADPLDGPAGAQEPPDDLVRTFEWGLDWLLTGIGAQA
jgi:AcrR family transcriptional regulator